MLSMWLIIVFIVLIGRTNAFSRLQATRVLSSCSSSNTRETNILRHLHAKLSTKNESRMLKFLRAASLSGVYDTSLLVDQMRAPVDPGPLTLKVKGLVLNTWGLLYGLSIFGTALLFMPFMIAICLFADLSGDSKRRRALDWVVHRWAKLAMSLLGTRATLYGSENLPPIDEAVVYVPNHTSFMDIMILSGTLPRPIKYLSKKEIVFIPFIGIAMLLSRHVFLSRSSLQSAFQVAEETVSRLKDGSSMVVFAEGSRSVDGRVGTFKKGAFQMAKSAQANIVPISLGNVHRWMPSNAILPLAPMRHVYVKVHPAIVVTPDSKISDLRNECRLAVNEGLPTFQQATTTSGSGTELQVEAAAASSE
jgi:1-acyl-sn-glycerol-3-phosphate acyltransferase